MTKADLERYPDNNTNTLVCRIEFLLNRSFSSRELAQNQNALAELFNGLVKKAQSLDWDIHESGLRLDEILISEPPEGAIPQELSKTNPELFQAVKKAMYPPSEPKLNVSRS